MIYDILDAFIDLSAVTSVEDHLSDEMYGAYSIFIGMDGAERNVVRSVNKYVPGEIERGRQAFAQLQAAISGRGAFVPRAPWPYRFGEETLDLADVRAIEKVQRIVNTEYSSRNGRRPTNDVKFRYTITMAGRPDIQRVVGNVPDVQHTGLHTEQENLLKAWLACLERRTAA